MNERVDPALVAGNHRQLANYAAQHFVWQVQGTVATITLTRPERKNPITFDSYAELRDLFRQLKYATDIHAVVITTAWMSVAYLSWRNKSRSSA